MVRNEDIEDVPETLTLDHWIRSLWKIGSFVEVHSTSSSKWVTGKITRIFVGQHHPEMLEIRYRVHGHSRSKSISRDDTVSLRPLSKAMHVYQYVFEAIHPQNGSLPMDRMLSTPIISDLDDLSENDNESDTPEPTGTLYTVHMLL